MWSFISFMFAVFFLFFFCCWFLTGGVRGATYTKGGSEEVGLGLERQLSGGREGG